MSFNTEDLADNSIASGCNVIIWDTLLAGVLTWFLLSEHITVVQIHPVFCIIGGFIGAALFFLLTQIKYINVLVLLFSCIEYELWISGKIIDFAQKEFEAFDTIWKWTIHIVLFLVIGLWHLGSYAAFDIRRNKKRSKATSDYSMSKSTYSPSTPITYNTTEDWNTLNKHYKNLQNHIIELLNEFTETVSSADAIANTGLGNDYLKASIMTTSTAFYHQYEEIQRLNEKIKNETPDYSKGQYIIDDMEEHYTTMLHLQHELMKETQKALTAHRDYQSATDNSFAGADESLFQGCTDKESLTKRYRNLMKIYHPDNSNGDLAMTQKIQYTYEKLLNRFS